MGSQTPARLAILMADTPLPGTVAKYKDYGGVFTALFEAAAAPQPLPEVLSLTYHDVVARVDSYPDLADVDAVLVTGSKHSAFADEAWILALVDFVRRALATAGRVKVVGVCFGHQIVARAMQTPVVVNDKGWEVAVTELELSSEGKQFFGLESTLKIHQMHRDIVKDLPDGKAIDPSAPPAVALASNDVCAQQGFLWPGRAVTVQGHPEFNEGIVREILELRHDAGIHPDDLYKSGISRVANEHDGVTIARAFLRFIRS